MSAALTTTASGRAAPVSRAPGPSNGRRSATSTATATTTTATTTATAGAARGRSGTRRRRARSPASVRAGAGGGGGFGAGVATEVAGQKSLLDDHIPVDRLYRGLRQLHQSPDVFLVDAFLSSDECDSIVAAAQTRAMDQSPVAGPATAPLTDPLYTFTACYLGILSRGMCQVVDNSSGCGGSGTKDTSE